MANPNIVAVSSIYANTVFDADVAASAVSLLTCGSNKVQKINSLVIANIDGSNAASIDVWITRSSADYYLAKTISVRPCNILKLSNIISIPPSNLKLISNSFEAYKLKIFLLAE